MAHRGALVTTIGIANQNIPNNTLQFLNFNTIERDTDGFFNHGAPSKITIPEGVSKVRLLGQVIFGSNASGLRQIVIKKNYIPGGGWYAGVPASTITANNATTTDVHVLTPVLDVMAGDFFQLEAYQTSGTTITALSSVGTWFAIEVIE